MAVPSRVTVPVAPFAVALNAIVAGANKAEVSRHRICKVRRVAAVTAVTPVPATVVATAGDSATQLDIVKPVTLNLSVGDRYATVSVGVAGANLISWYVSEPLV